MDDRDRIYILLRKALEIARRGRRGMLVTLIVLAIEENISAERKGGGA